MKSVLLLLLCLLPMLAAAQHEHHHMHHSAAGMVMGENLDRLPRGCEQVDAEHEFTVHVGARHAEGMPGKIYGYSQHEFRVEPCSRVTVTLVNDDEVRHQWMVHGLPHYLYDRGMFHIETNGGESLTGTLIVPADDRTYLVHCDMAQHMEKGLKGQLVVGSGSGDLWSVPGVSDAFYRDSYARRSDILWLLLAAAVGAALLALLLRPGRSP